MKITIIGYGKMGKAIEKIAKEAGHQITHVFSSHNIQDLKKIDKTDSDIAIEFTDPKSAYSNILQCLKIGIPIISGTTGWLDKKQQVDDYCKEKNGSFFYTTNFSIGMNLLFNINKQLASLANSNPEFSISIEETHHTEKKDTPSGTAITLATDIIHSVNRLESWNNHHPTFHNPKDLPITSIRTPNVAGIHTITYKSPIETIQISHTAISRNSFANGVVSVAEWMIDKKGVLGMGNFLQNLT